MISQDIKFPEAFCVGGVLMGGSLIPKEDFPPPERPRVIESVVEKMAVEMMLPIFTPASGISTS